jgi:PAS domain S-box-containing protein
VLHAEIAAERSRLAALIDHLPEGVVIAAAPDGRLALSNQAAAALLGRAVAGETVGQYVPAYALTLADGSPFPQEQLPLVRALQGETVHGIEVWAGLPDGQRRPLLVSAAPLHEADGRIVDAVAVFQDIAEIKEAQRRKDEWLAIASHELRTPVTSLRGFAQFLVRQQRRGELLNDNTLRDGLETINRQADRLAELVHDLVDISRIQRGRVELRRRAFDLNDLIRVTVVRLADADPDAGTRLRLDLPAESLHGVWDYDRIDQALTNLISNALKYDPGGAHILIRAGREGDNAFVSVHDSGIGVPALDMERLFQPFSRATNAFSHGAGGIGLGLYISRDIIERHGGHVTVESKEGAGSTFGFTLPLEAPTT